jgi:hypothetical protein
MQAKTSLKCLATHYCKGVREQRYNRQRILPFLKKWQKIFGSPAKAIGKTVRYQDRKTLRVTAVFDNVPITSSAQFDYVINWQSFLENNEWAKDWDQ